MIDILNKIYKDSKESFYNSLREKLEKEEKAFVITANPEIIMMSQENPRLVSLLLNSETTVVPDGIGVIKYGKKLDIHIQEKITGIDLTESLFELANQTNKSIYCYGSKQKTLDSLKGVLESIYPNIQIKGLKNGYDYKAEEVFRDIEQKEPDVVLIALGVPKQEIVIEEYYSKLKKGICVGVGGSLDVLSGNKKRAPMFLRKKNLEWLYRIIKEPRRVKRFYNYNLKFYIKMKSTKKKTDDERNDI